MCKDYTSSSGHPCTAAQYITELLIARRAKAYKKPLPPKYWNKEPWKKQYKLTIIAVNSMLKIYSPGSIIEALTCKEGSRIYSLRHPKFKDIVAEKENIREQRKNNPVIEVEDNTLSKPMKNFGTKTTINKLRELDE